MIDLFNLHDNTEDKGAYSWIVVDGPRVFLIFKQLINEITEKLNHSVPSLPKRISKRIGCSDSMLYDILNGRTKWIPLRLIDDLLTIFRKLDGNKEATKIKNEFLNSIKFFKSTPRSTLRTKAVKKLSPELAEFCGIHAADGSLNLQISIEALHRERINKIKRELNNKFSKLRISKVYKRDKKYRIFFNVTDKIRAHIFNFLNGHNINFSVSYKLEFVDSSKESMEYLRGLLFKLFGYRIKIKSIRTAKGYYAVFSNKVIGRYIKNIFGFPLGKKSNIVDAPNLIKKAPFIIRKAFVRGVIQFDGSVGMKGKVKFSTNSKKLLSFFLKVIKRENIRGRAWRRKDRKQEFGFESPSTKQWLTYFIKGTSKHQRLYEHIYGFRGKANSIEQAIKIFEKALPLTSRSFLTFPKLIKTASKLKEFTRYQILNELKKDYAARDYKSLSTKLDILEKASIIKVNPVKMTDRFERKSDKIAFNNKVREWDLPLP